MLYGIRQTEKRTNTVWYPLYVDSKKKKKRSNSEKQRIEQW